MTIFKKGPRKLTRTTLVTGKKGQIVIQKTNRVFKRIRLANLASKREQQPLESPEVASRLLQTKMRVVVLILDGIAKDPCGGVMKLSDNIGYYSKTMGSYLHSEWWYI